MFIRQANRRLDKVYIMFAVFLAAVLISFLLGMVNGSMSRAEAIGAAQATLGVGAGGFAAIALYGRRPLCYLIALLCVVILAALAFVSS